MQQVRAGRTGALATLFERHHARLYRYCLRMTGDRQASEDLVQDVFMRVLRYKATFKHDSSFVPWMFGIARNACVAHLKRATVHRERTSEVEHEPADAAGDEPDADHRQTDLVRRALLALPLERREVLVLSRFEYKSYEEIAEALGCSAGAVKVRVHRAIKQLREIYLGLAGEAST
jgi:RNA polymerase sigma-70 factor, ECF subfamily